MTEQSVEFIAEFQIRTLNALKALHNASGRDVNVDREINALEDLMKQRVESESLDIKAGHSKKAK